MDKPKMSSNPKPVTWQRRTAGVTLILLGLVAGFVPLVPGALLIFIGLEFLGFRLLFLDRWRGKKLSK